MKIDSWLLDVLACPKCHSTLRADEAASELVCTSADCGLAYPVRDDIPVLLIDEARDPSVSAAAPRDTTSSNTSADDESDAATDETGA